jgi:SAM-dependent methyltransferase
MSDAHGFTAVDDQPDPRAWVEVLDRIGREPFYRSYKLRLAELLGPVAGGRYLEVGAGTGADALELGARCGCSVVGVDASETMVAEALRRGLADAVVADAHALPFEAAAFDGCWADRTFQHLADPTGALAELVRVTRPGGRVVAADPDYETQVTAVGEAALAERIRRRRVAHLRNGGLAHRMGALFVQAGLADVQVEARTLVVHDARAVDGVMGLRSWADGTGDEDPWRAAFDAAVAEGTFLYAVTFFLTVGTVES